MNITLTKQQKDWLKAKVDSGDYATMAEVLRELIRNKMEREQKNQELRDFIDEGDSGPFVPFDMDKIIQEAEAEFEAKEI